ncbi:MAG: hypothetical protein KGN16_14990 [Burkholderiales bacterium]|nr:hypothetical protein [Burkholderiales bacterium]
MSRNRRSADKVMEEALMTASSYMKRAALEIDKFFGEGYAEDHPELVAAFMQAAAADMQTMWTAATIEDGLYEVADNLRRIADAPGGLSAG